MNDYKVNERIIKLEKKMLTDKSKQLNERLQLINKILKNVNVRREKFIESQKKFDIIPKFSVYNPATKNSSTLFSSRITEHGNLSSIVSSSIQDIYDQLDAHITLIETEINK